MCEYFQTTACEPLPECVIRPVVATPEKMRTVKNITIEKSGNQLRKDLQSHGSGRKSQKQPAPVADGNPNGKSPMIGVGVVSAQNQAGSTAGRTIARAAAAHTFTDAADFGFSATAGGMENTRALQRAADHFSVEPP